MPPEMKELMRTPSGAKKPPPLLTVMPVSSSPLRFQVKGPSGASSTPSMVT